MTGHDDDGPERDETTVNDLLPSASTDELVKRARSVAEAVTGVGLGAVSTLSAPGRRPVVRLLKTLDQLLAQVPPIHQELDVIVAELHAQRLSVQSLRAQLDALDTQLELFARSLEPLQSWNQAWERVRDSLGQAVARLEH
jgi:hypothetical protein